MSKAGNGKFCPKLQIFLMLLNAVLNDVKCKIVIVTILFYLFIMQLLVSVDELTQYVVYG